LQKRGGIRGEDAGDDFDLMVEMWVREDFETGADSAAFGIVGAVNETRNAGLNDGSGAHATRLDGDVQRGAGETIVAEQARGFAKGDHFGVGCGIAIANGAIAGAGEDLAVADEDGADGNFAGRCRGASFGERFLHELDVSVHLLRENNMQGRQSRM
jgi:hypothetical protein